MKKVAILALTFAFALSLAACGNGGGGSKDGNAAPASTSGDNGGSGGGDKQASSDDGGAKGGEQVTLRVMWWGSQARHDLTLKVIDLYEKSHPNVKIEPEFTGWSGYWEKLSAEVAGNEMPDVVQMNFGEYLTQYSGKGLLYDMNDLAHSGKLDVSQVNAGLLKSGTVDGKLLGIPLAANALGVIYDPQMLQDAGAKEPDINWTWDDYKEMATKVHEKTGSYGTKVLDIDNVFEYWLRQNGQKMFSDDLKGLGYSNDKLLADYMQMNLDLADKGVAANLAVTNQIKALEDELIVHSKSAFDFRWSNQLVALTKAAGRPLKIAPFPGPNIDKGMYLKPSMFFSISKNTKHAEAAADFISFFINDIEAGKVLGAERGVPVSPKVVEALKGSLSDTDKLVYDYIDLIGQHSSPIDANYPQGSAEVIQALKDMNEKVMYKKESPEEGAKEFRQNALDIISRSAK